MEIQNLFPGNGCGGRQFHSLILKVLVQVPPTYFEKLIILSKYMQLNFGSSRQISIAEMEDQFARDFELSWNLD